MAKQLKEKIIPFGITFASLIVALPQFLKIYGLGKNWLAISICLVFCLIAVFIVRPFFRFSLYLLAALFGLYLYFPKGESFSLDWFFAFIEEFKQLFLDIAQADLRYVSGEIALSLVLFMVLFLIEQLIRNNRIVFSYTVIIGYLLVLAVYNDVNLTQQVVLLVGLALLFKSLQSKRLFQQKMIAGFLVATIIALTLFLPLNSLKSSFTEHTSFVRDTFNDLGVYNYIQQTGTGAPSRTGFSEDDRLLGGPLIDDDQVLFQALQKKEHYWRVESKNFYTGTGWSYGNDFPNELTKVEDSTIELFDNLYEQTYAEEETIQLHFFRPLSYFPLPYGDQKITVDTDNTGFIFFEENKRLDSQQPSESMDATIQWTDFDYQVDDLGEIENTQPPVAIDYLQLPDKYSEKVTQLATELTQNQASLLQKVLAIQEYLKFDGGFRYSKMDAGFPEKGQDYVEHFLFDEKVGYCDNFSSSMVVMLRSVGIPARWAKGFSPGEVVANQGEYDQYEVRNKNAHSWPEVYFDGYGWLPFEPTPSFSQPLQVEKTTDSTTQEVAPTPSSTTESTSEDATDTSTTSQVDGGGQDPTFSLWDSLKDWWTQYVDLFATFGRVLLMLALAILLFYLGKYAEYLMILFVLKTSTQPLLKAYPILLKKIEKKHPRLPDQSLNRYAAFLKEIYPEWGPDFLELTSRYEAEIYGNQLQETESDHQKIRELAKKLSKKRRKAW